MWHVCDVQAIWVKEFAAALGRHVPVLGWLPEASIWAGLRRSRATISNLEELQVWKFPLQLGFRRFPVRLVIDERRRIRKHLARIDGALESSTLVITFPTYHWLASDWPGPTVYYATDAFRFWTPRAAGIEQMERALCARVDMVCPDSARIADYMAGELGVSNDKIVVSPMAAPAADLLPAPAGEPGALPADLADLPRPIAGVIGNLAGNLDWPLIEEVVGSTPWLSWTFVGPIDMPMASPDEAAARSRLAKSGNPRVRFVGFRPYRSLRDYARAFDVAVLPYKKIEPTYSGSSTRFYGHLAACRPIVATRGFEELLHKEPLLRLAGNSSEMAAELENLRSTRFRDGRELLRWEASRKETWECRAQTMMDALAARTGSAL